MEWIVLQDDEMLVSFDVKSLFTSIPVSEAIDICERRLQMDKTLSKRTSMDVNTIISLIRFCLTNTSFLYGGKPYQQLDGVAMGSPLSPVIADIFMADLEEKAIAGASEDIAPSVWKRYVDDIISVVKRKKGHSSWSTSTHNTNRSSSPWRKRAMGRYHLLISDSPGMNTGRLCAKCIVNQHTQIGMCSSHTTILRQWSPESSTALSKERPLCPATMSCSKKS